MIARYLQTLDQKDRRALLILGSFLLLVVLIWGILMPTWHYYQSGKTAVTENRELLQWMQANAHRVTSSPQNENQGERNLLDVLTQTAESHDLDISRFQPQQQDKVRLWLNQANYTQAIEWLKELQRDHGIRIESITIDRTEVSGLVNIQCTLM